VETRIREGEGAAGGGKAGEPTEQQDSSWGLLSSPCLVGGKNAALTLQRLLAGPDPEAMGSQEAATAQEGRESQTFS